MKAYADVADLLGSTASSSQEHKSAMTPVSAFAPYHCVFVLSGDTISSRIRPQFFHLCTSLEDAVHLAIACREMFGCPAWVEDYWRPANTHTMLERKP
jgi:hypothetical protein